MKSLIAIFVISTALATSLKAQNKSVQYQRLFEQSDSLIKAYMSSVSLADLGRSQLSQDQIAAYKSLFVPGTTVPDDLPALNAPSDLPMITIDNYVSAIKANFPAGLNTRLTNSVLDLTDVANGRISITVHKRLEGLDESGLQLRATAQQVLAVRFLPGSIGQTPLKISGVSNGSSATVVLNDDDGDMVPNDRDKCPKEFGAAKWGGCPPPKPAFYLTPLLSFSSPTSSSTTIGSLNNPYNKTYESRYAEVPTDILGKFSMQGPAIGFSLLADYYFDPRARFGISVGLGYGSVKYSMAASPFSASYERINENKDAFSYEQRINSADLSFKGKINSINIPIAIAWRIQIDSSLALVFRPGLQISMMSISGTTQGNFDYAVGTTYDEGKYGYNPSSDNVDLFIGNGHKGHYGERELDILRNEQGYNVGYRMERSVDGKRSLMAFGPNINLNAEYALSPRSRIILGVGWSQLKYSGESEGDKSLVDAADMDDLQPLQNYISEINVSFITLQAGITYPFIKKEK